MSWALLTREALRRGGTAQVKPHGHSMRGKVNDGDIVTLGPVAPEALAPSSWPASTAATICLW